MFELPSRHALAKLTEAATAAIPTAALGFARGVGDGLVAVLYSHQHGSGEYILNSAILPDALKPGDGLLRGDAASIASKSAHPVEWQLTLAGAHSIVSLQVPDVEPPTRLWVGLSRDESPTNNEMQALERVAEMSTALLIASASADREIERLRRLERAAGLLPPLLRVLDVREVFDRLSAISQAALPHDLLTLGLFNDDLSTMTVYAKSDERSTPGTKFCHPYPAAVTQAWQFDILDDRAVYPLEQERPATALGMRSSLRVPFRVDGVTLGGLGFHASKAIAYQSDDVAIARRLADQVAVALCHHRLAVELAEQTRRSEELRAQTANLEVLDELLGSLADSGGVKEAFGRVSGIADTVLRHDAVVMMVRLPDGLHGRLYASTGFSEPLPEIQEIPAEVLRTPDWDHHIIDDITLEPEPRYARLVNQGFYSLLRVSIRLDANSPDR